MVKELQTMIFFLVVVLCGQQFQRQPDDVQFSFAVQKDSIYIGEPLVITMRFVNNSDQKRSIPEPPTLAQVAEGSMNIKLILPDGKIHTCNIGIHVTPENRPYAVLAPHESLVSVVIVDLHTFFGYKGYLMGDNEREVRMAPEGSCTLKISFRAPGVRLQQSISFNWVRPKGLDAKMLKKLCDAHITWEWLPLSEKKQHEVLKIIMNSNTIYAQYGHYQYAVCLQSLEERLALLRKFMDSYPQSSLRMVAWGRVIIDLRRAGKSKEAEEEVVKLQREYPGYVEGNRNIEMKQ